MRHTVTTTLSLCLLAACTREAPSAPPAPTYEVRAPQSTAKDIDPDMPTSWVGIRRALNLAQGERKRDLRAYIADHIDVYFDEMHAFYAAIPLDPTPDSPTLADMARLPNLGRKAKDPRVPSLCDTWVRTLHGRAHEHTLGRTNPVSHLVALCLAQLSQHGPHDPALAAALLGDREHLTSSSNYTGPVLGYASKSAGDAAVRDAARAWADAADPTHPDTKRTVGIAFNAMRALGVTPKTHPELFAAAGK